MVAEGLIRVLRIRGWERHYENSRTIPMKKMQWIPLSNRLDSNGYSTIMSKRNGPAVFGCWIALLELASVCSPRGFLLKSAQTPHDPRSIGLVTRIDPRTIRAALKVLIRIKWLEEVEVPVSSPPPTDVRVANRSPLREGRKEGRDFVGSDAADGLGPTGPPAAGRQHRNRRALPLPPAAAEDLARIRARLDAAPVLPEAS